MIVYSRRWCQQQETRRAIWEANPETRIPIRAVCVGDDAWTPREGKGTYNPEGEGLMKGRLQNQLPQRVSEAEELWKWYRICTPESSCPGCRQLRYFYTKACPSGFQHCLWEAVVLQNCGLTCKGNAVAPRRQLGPRALK